MVSRLQVVLASDWPLLTDGSYSEVFVRAGLTVLAKSLEIKVKDLKIFLLTKA